jgi:hypothetical protein
MFSSGARRHSGNLDPRRVVFLTEQEHWHPVHDWLPVIHCQPKDFRPRTTHRVRRTWLVTPLGTRLLASIFGTLLSSQGSDAHRCSAQWARRRGNPSNLPVCFLGVKSVTHSWSGRIRSLLALGGSLTLAAFAPDADHLAGAGVEQHDDGSARVSTRDRPASGKRPWAHTPWCPFLPLGLT